MNQLGIDDIKKLLPFMTPEEIEEVSRLVVDGPVWSPLPGPQSKAYYSKADIIGFGGSAGGGKSDLIAGLCLLEHERSLIARREKAQTEGIVQRFAEILGGTDGYSSQKGAWRLPGNRLCEFAGLDNVGDERRWQGRPHDLIAFDEATEQRELQVRFVMGWARTRTPGQKVRVLMTFNPPTTAEGRWVIDFFGPWLDKKHPLYPTPPGELRWVAMLPDENGQSCDTWSGPDGDPLRPDPFVIGDDGSLVYDFNPDDYSKEDIIHPKSRTFIPSRVTDNPYYVDSGYLVTLQALPEPLRSQMLYGDFHAGVEDDPWQVIPTAWVEAAQARWRLPDKIPEMDSVGVDVARGGKDKTIISRRHGMWFNAPLVYPGAQTPDGPTVAGLTIAAMRDRAVIHLDVIGVGSSPYDFLRDAKTQVVGVNVAEAATCTDQSGRLKFANLRSQLWWKFREALDPANNTGIALPPGSETLADLTAPTWSMSGSTIKVASREDIIKKIGRSPDYGSAYVLALMDTPKRSSLDMSTNSQRRLKYDPYKNL